jgi:hypothetical protein
VGSSSYLQLGIVAAASCAVYAFLALVVALTARERAFLRGWVQRRVGRVPSSA